MSGRTEDRSDREPAGAGTATELGRYAGHGLTIALSTALFAWVGVWVDERLHTAPLFVMVGVFTGFGAGFYSMYRGLVRPDAGSDGGSDGDSSDGSGDRRVDRASGHGEDVSG